MDKIITPEQMQEMLDSIPFIRFLGLQAVSIDYETQSVTLRMPMRPELERLPDSGQVHGGPIASLIDTAGDFALVSIVGAPVPTINYRVDYLRPAAGDGLLGVARVRRAGRNVGVVDIDVIDTQERLVAVGRGCYAMAAG